MVPKVLVVEDDIDLNNTLAKFLKLKCFEVEIAYDGEVGVNLAYENSFDIIILDVKLPRLNGFEVAKEIREFSNTPIIFLTSLDTQKDIEKGFIIGGDDYITKPFSLNELLLRVKAIHRRLYGNNESIKIGEDIEFSIENLTLRVGDNKVKLKQKVAKLLELFLQNPNRILSKDEILEYIYGFNEEPNEESLRTFISKLRRYLPKGAIESIRGVGYRYVAS